MLPNLIGAYMLLKMIIAMPLNCEQSSSLLDEEQIELPIDYVERPCVKVSPNVDDCFVYDKRLLASTIEQALHTFPDLSSYDFDNEPLIDAEEFTPTSSKDSVLLSSQKMRNYSSEAEYSCKSAECLSCKQVVIEAFTTANMKPSRLDDQRSRSLLANASLCEQILFRKFGHRNFGNIVTSSSTIPSLEIDPPNHRLQAVNNNSLHTPVLGQAMSFGRSYKKGNEIEKGWAGLCSLSWQWRLLPAVYFPRVINEVACDNNDLSCLGGKGSCRPVYQPISVFRNNGTKQKPHWIAESVDRIASCECRVRMGLHFAAAKLNGRL
ncbi:unnamed protein product [Toxocara canis]|uniref:Putative G-protein coupled receptor C02B8.5 n=1 Tax=Toxocara canis TaxID=6265 RepID=A0A183V847_TOXCA|nr:unnamed protein product [Toxocara canis]